MSHQNAGMIACTWVTHVKLETSYDPVTDQQCPDVQVNNMFSSDSHCPTMLTDDNFEPYQYIPHPINLELNIMILYIVTIPSHISNHLTWRGIWIDWRITEGLRRHETIINPILLLDVIPIQFQCPIPQYWEQPVNDHRYASLVNTSALNSRELSLVTD